MLIELDRLEVGHHRRPILPPITFGLAAGAFVGIVGPNGSGKTTLLRTILALLPPVRGQIRYPRLGRSPRVGYVPQRQATDLTWPLSALEIVLMGRYRRIGIARWRSRDDLEAARAALAQVGIADLAERPFHALSGGQQQRVLTARALCGEPELLLLDEPTTGMDLAAERSMLELIAGFPARGIAVVMVSHALSIVASYARDIILIDRDRSQVDAGPVHEVLTAERLSKLYGTPVSVVASHGYVSVFADRPSGPGGEG